MMYAGAPLALGALRLQKPDLPRAYRLPFGEVLAPLSFILANFIVYWSGWQTYSTLMVVMMLGFALMLISGVFHLNPNQPEIDWDAAIWVFPYLIGMGVISYLGGFGAVGIIGGVGVVQDGLGRWQRRHQAVLRPAGADAVQPGDLLPGDVEATAADEGRRVRPRRLPAAGSRVAADVSGVLPRHAGTGCRAQPSATSLAIRLMPSTRSSSPRA